MPINYPGTSLDTFNNPDPTKYEDDTGYELDLLITKLNDVALALETKLGTGTSTAAADTVLRGTGSGVTSYGKVTNAYIDSAAAIAVSKLSAGGAANRVVRTTDGTTTVWGQVTSADLADQSVVVFADQGSTPSAPGADKGKFYLNADSMPQIIIGASATAGNPMLRGVRNWLRNGACRVFSIGQASKSCPTTYDKFDSFLADGWFVQPTGAAVTQQAGASILGAPGSIHVVGAASCTGYKVAQRFDAIIASLMSSLGLTLTFSWYFYNGSGGSLAPTFTAYTPGASNNFGTLTSRATYTPSAIANGAMARFSYTITPSGFTNIAYGLELAVSVPTAGAGAGFPNRFGGFQLEEGGSPTDLEILPLAFEKYRCAEWMHHSYLYGSLPGSNIGLTGCRQTFSDGSGAQIAGQEFPVSMPYAPSIRVYAGDGTINRVSTISSGAPGGPTTVAAGDIWGQGFRQISATAGSYSATTPYTYHYWASCELS